jgi:hypothetical protein
VKSKSLLVLCIAFAFAAALRAEPPLNVQQAQKIAQDYLKSEGLGGKHFISAIVLEKNVALGNSLVWYVQWSPEVREDGRSESGIRIGMDGKIAQYKASSARDYVEEYSQKGSRKIH